MVNIDKIKTIAKSNGIKLKFICHSIGVSEAFFDQITQVRTHVVQKCICDTDEDAAEIKIFAVFSFSQIKKSPDSALS